MAEIVKTPFEKNVENIVSKVLTRRDERKAEASPEVEIPSVATPGVGAIPVTEKRPRSKPIFFPDVKREEFQPSWDKKNESATGPEKRPGIFKQGLKYTIDQLNPIKAFKEIRENWRESGAQFNEELFEEKQIEIFFQDIPEAERENYGYSELLQRARIIDQARGTLFEKKNDKRKQFAGIFSALGIKRDIVDDEEVKRLEANSSDQHKVLLEIGMKAFAKDPQKLKKFLNQFDRKDLAFREENLEMYFRAQNGNYGDKIVYGLDRIGRTFKEIGFLRKMAITSIGTGGVVIGGAVLGFGALGVSTMMLGSRLGISALGGLSLGIGKKFKYEGKRRIHEDMAKADNIEEVMQVMGRNVDEGIQKMHESISVGEFRTRRAEQIFKDNRKAALWGVISASLGRVAGEYLAHEGITFRSLLEKIGIIGGGGMVKPSVPENIPGTKPSVEPMPKLSNEDVDQIQKAFEDARPGKSMDDFVNGINKEHADEIINRATNIPEGSTKINIAEDVHRSVTIPEPEIKTGGFISEAQQSLMTGTESSAPEISKPQFEDIASVKIKAGGSMWGSIENNIKANPEAYGLDPKHPNFTKDMHQMTRQMLDEFASRKGLSYEQLDQMTRGKVKVGDTFKIIHDPSTDDIYIDDFHGKAFGADVSRGASVEEIASSKPISSLEGGKLAPEDVVKPRTGAVDHQPVRGAGKIAGMEDIEAEQAELQKYSADMDKYRADLSRFHGEQAAQLEAVNEVANSRLYLSTRGLLTRLTEGAGISKHADFWEQPMGEWKKLLGPGNYISQDPQFIDQTRALNLNYNRLRDLFPILEKYHTQGIESIGDCLKEAVKDSKDLLRISALVLRK